MGGNPPAQKVAQKVAQNPPKIWAGFEILGRVSAHFFGLPFVDIGLPFVHTSIRNTQRWALAKAQKVTQNPPKAALWQVDFGQAGFGRILGGRVFGRVLGDF